MRCNGPHQRVDVLTRTLVFETVVTGDDAQIGRKRPDKPANLVRDQRNAIDMEVRNMQKRVAIEGWRQVRVLQTQVANHRTKGILLSPVVEPYQLKTRLQQRTDPDFFVSKKPGLVSELAASLFKLFFSGDAREQAIAQGGLFECIH